MGKQSTFSGLYEEDLEITRHLDEEEKIASLGEYDQLHEEVTKEIESEKAKEEKVEDPSTSSEQDDQGEDSENVESLEIPESSEEDPGSESSEKEDEKDNLNKTDSGRQSVVTESLRSEYYERTVTEAIEFSDFTDAARTAATYIGSKLSDLASVLAALGIKYTPVALRALRKGVAYLYLRSTKLLLKGAVSLVATYKEQSRIHNRSKAKVVALKETLEKLTQEKPELSLKTEFTTDKELVDWFTAGTKTDPFNSIKVMTQFVQNSLNYLETETYNDQENVIRLIELTRSSTGTDPLKFMEVRSLSPSFLKRQVVGYAEDNEYTESYVYGQGLPDRVLLIAQVPRNHLSNLEEVAEAYKSSSIVLGVNTTHRASSDKVDYMEPEELKKFIESIELLCELKAKHLENYRQIAKGNQKMKLGYRHYFQKLITSPEKLSVRDSLVEFVYLKQSFISRVYLPAAMDIHDYINAYLTRALRYVKENTKALT